MTGLKWRGSGDLISDVDGQRLNKEEAQRRIVMTIERCGRFILASPIQPEIGDINHFAGLPFRVVRFITHDEATLDCEATKDIWQTDPPIEPDDFYFEVEVAD